MSMGELRVALVHDELTRRGGAEIVFEELIRIFPNADVYALYTGKPRITVDDKKYTVRTSSLQRWPVWFRRHPARMLPFLPSAAEQLDLSEYDIVISSASAFAKAIVTRSHVPHICYLHTPTRYIWERGSHSLNNRSGFMRTAAEFLSHYLRLVDYAAAQRIELVLANSKYTAERSAKYYRRQSTVVYPPIDTAFFTPTSAPRLLGPTVPYLCVGRLTASKNFEQAIAACEKLEAPLYIVGRGSYEKKLKRLAHGKVRFMRLVTPEQLRDLYRTSRALLQPGIEDFGMATAEAQACGLPVIAYGRGGVREIVQHMETGFLYAHQRVEALAEAMRKFEQVENTFNVSTAQQQALRYSRSRFKEGIVAAVHSAQKINSINT